MMMLVFSLPVDKDPETTRGCGFSVAPCVLILGSDVAGAVDNPIGPAINSLSNGRCNH